MRPGGRPNEPRVTERRGPLAELRNHQPLWLDIMIILKTIGRVLTLKGTSGALVRVLTDERVRSAYIQEGWLHAETFSQAETARLTYAVYREALGDGA